MGLALLSTIAASRTSSVLASDPHGGFANALVEGFHRGFVVGACFAVAAAILTLLTISRDVGRVDVDRPVETQPEPRSAYPVEGIAVQIAEAVGSWEGATSYALRSGDVELRAADSQLGYLHGDTLADLLLPTGIRDHAIATGLAHQHQVLPDSNWVTVHIRRPEQLKEIVALLRSAYDGVMRSAFQSPAAD